MAKIIRPIPQAVRESYCQDYEGKASVNLTPNFLSISFQKNQGRIEEYYR